MKKEEITPEGTLKVKSNDLNFYILKDNEWSRSRKKIKSTQKAIDSYKKKGNIAFLIDDKENEFLKGKYLPENIPAGQRITILPSGKKISRGGFSLFAKNLKINTSKKFKWDICYENVSGLKTYLYDEDKIHLEQKRKAKIVDEFEKSYLEILEKLEKDIKRTGKIKYLGLAILLKTKMRVGNLEYYLNSKHKGLTTIQKKDIKIIGNKIIIDYIGKDEIPQHKEAEFENYFIEKIKTILDEKENEDFIFTDLKGLPLHSTVFSKILFKYTGKHFYPHIIRSWHADRECKQFFNYKRKASKKEVLNKLKQIANDLGHKKFNKNKNTWEPDYKITVSNYIRPKYYEKMKKLYEKV